MYNPRNFYNKKMRHPQEHQCRRIAIGEQRTIEGRLEQTFRDYTRKELTGVAGEVLNRFPYFPTAEADTPKPVTPNVNPKIYF